VLDRVSTGQAVERDWLAWHAGYDRPSDQRRRLQVVRNEIRLALDAQPPGTVRVISLCAGQGRDILPVVACHRRRADVRARLVELDPRNTRIAAAVAERLELPDVEVVTGDASLTSGFADAVPADIVLVCGVFGNVAAPDVEHTIRELPTLCAAGAAVVWTRGRRAPDLRAAIRRWFGLYGFAERSFHGEPETYGVGVHVLASEPRPFDPSVRLFTFFR